METARGVLLGADEVTVAGAPWVRLWLAREDARFQAWVRAEPALFAVPAEGVAPESLLVEARRRAVAAEVVERRVGRSTRRVVRVVARHSGDLVDLRRGLASLADVEEVLEADVPLEHRVLFERDLRPTAGVVVEGGADWRVPGLVAADVRAADAPPVAWRTVAVAGEFESAGGAPDPSRDRVRRLALAAGDAPAEVLADEDEGALLAAFRARFLALDPDVVLTWGGDLRLWPFLVARGEALGVRMALARDGGDPEVRGAGANRTATIAGRAHVDLRRVAERDLRWEVKVKTLASVAEHLGVEVDEEPEGSAAAEAEGARALGRALTPLQEAFARLTRLPLEEASRAGRGRQVEALLMGEAARLGILAPKRGGEEAPEEEYEGGFVLDPRAGLHEDVVALDFGAMYPTLMISRNVSPDTYVPPGEPAGGEVWTAPEVGHRFRKEPDGFFRRILRDLVESRRALKRSLRELPEGPERQRVDVEQASIKVLTNAMYGYTGWAQARWGSRPCAEATAACGREAIRWVMDAARGRGYDVLYGDTDSLFLRAPGDLADFVAEVNRSLPLELEIAERYRVLLFTTAKKKYAGLTEDGKLVARGFEIRRGDWCAYARAVQERVLTTVLEERNAAKGLVAAREAVDRLRAGDVPPQDLVLWKTLTARPSAYRSKPMHAAAVERAEAARPGLHMEVGTKVGVVVLEGAGPVHERAVLHDLRAGAPLDHEWYVEKQVAPASLRVLETFGTTADEIKGAPKQRSLAEFF